MGDLETSEEKTSYHFILSLKRLHLHFESLSFLQFLCGKKRTLFHASKENAPQNTTQNLLFSKQTLAPQAWDLLLTLLLLFFIQKTC